MSLFNWKKKKPTPSPEELRHQGDAAKLAEYQAFDTAVGSWPTAGTLQSRFSDAVFAGHTEVIKDSIAKGVVVPNEVTTIFAPIFGEGPVPEPVAFTDKTLEIAARNNWPDMAEVLLPYADKANLDAGLSTAEFRKNAPIAKAIKAEMAKRAAAP